MVEEGGGVEVSVAAMSFRGVIGLNKALLAKCGCQNGQILEAEKKKKSAFEIIKISFGFALASRFKATSFIAHFQIVINFVFLPLSLSTQTAQIFNSVQYPLVDRDWHLENNMAMVPWCRGFSSASFSPQGCDQLLCLSFLLQTLQSTIPIQPFQHYLGLPSFLIL